MLSFYKIYSSSGWNVDESSAQFKKEKEKEKEVYVHTPLPPKKKTNKTKVYVHRNNKSSLSSAIISVCLGNFRIINENLIIVLS